MTHPTISTLGGVSMKTMTASWNKAFDDYAVKITMDEESLGRFFRQNGVRLEASIGAFDGDTPVGIWLNGIREIDGVLTAYDSGTAIWPEFRNQGVSKLLAEKSTMVLKDIGVVDYVLEVMQKNETAFSIYKKSGFEVTRRFICFAATSPTFDDAVRDPGFDVKETTVADLMDMHLPPTERLPSWQNRLESSYEIRDRVRGVAAWKDGRMVGYGLIQTDRGRIPQIGISPNYWETDLPSVILMWLCDRVEAGKEIALINVDEDAKHTIALLSRHGFVESVRQYEMRKKL